jgi:hypothetical protein
MVCFRFYGVLPLLCPACGGQMKILAVFSVRPILGHGLQSSSLPDLEPVLEQAEMRKKTASRRK